LFAGELFFKDYNLPIRRLVNRSQNRGLTEMARQVAVVLYPLAMAAVIVGVDFAFLRNRFWERLIVNIGIVLVFAGFYWIFLRRQ
jgi:lipopolysaccharide export LptBFGC system permease protein LptF